MVSTIDIIITIIFLLCFAINLIMIYKLYANRACKIFIASSINLLYLLSIGALLATSLGFIYIYFGNTFICRWVRGFTADTCVVAICGILLLKLFRINRIFNSGLNNAGIKDKSMYKYLIIMLSFCLGMRIILGSLSPSVISIRDAANHIVCKTQDPTQSTMASIYLISSYSVVFIAIIYYCIKTRRVPSLWNEGRDVRRAILFWFITGFIPVLSGKLSNNNIEIGTLIRYATWSINPTIVNSIVIISLLKKKGLEMSSKTRSVETLPCTLDIQQPPNSSQTNDLEHIISTL